MERSGWMGWVGVSALLLGLGSGAEAGQVLPMGLDDLVEGSQRIFVGSVVGIETGRAPGGLPYVAYRFDVTRPVMGVETGDLEVRFIGSDDPAFAFSPIAGLPRYVVGDTALLFLRAPSPQGLTSPMGLELGSLPVRRHDGDAFVHPHPVLVQESLHLTPSERRVLDAREVSLEAFLTVVEGVALRGEGLR